MTAPSKAAMDAVEKWIDTWEILTAREWQTLAQAFDAFAASQSAELLEALEEALRQLEYMHKRWPTGSGATVISKTAKAITKAKGDQP